MKRDHTKQNTKDRIFTIAVELFSKKGFHGTSMRDLAREVGIKESSLYNHFPGKNAILEAILEYYKSGFQSAMPTGEEWESIVEQFSDPAEIWITAAKEYINRLPPLMNLISRILLNEMFLDSRCRDFVLHSMFTAQKEVTEMVLTDLHKRGMIRDCDIRTIAEQYVYMLHGFDIEQRLLETEGHNYEVTQKKLLEHITHFFRQLRK